MIGPLDDVVALALRSSARLAPREVLEAAGTGDASTLDRLLGRGERPSRRGGEGHQRPHRIVAVMRLTPPSSWTPSSVL